MTRAIFASNIFLMNSVVRHKFTWCIYITPKDMQSFGDYPIPGKDGIPLCQKHGNQLEMKEVVLFNKEATEANPPDHCWVCE